jgi:Ca2+-binding RTX toxin-like protein
MAIINDDDKSRRLVGTQFDDQINGNGGNDILVGGFGADVLNGGSDKDTASYEDSIEGVIVQMGEGGFSGGLGGTAQGDTYISIENVTGSVFDDFVFGDEENNTIIGGGGTDSLFGGVGDDHLLGAGQQFGGADDDTLESFGAKDALFGGEGDVFGFRHWPPRRRERI